MKEPMVNVTSASDEVIDIWPYVTCIATEVELPAYVLENELVEVVYRSGDGLHDHVLLPTEKENKFLVVVVDRPWSRIAGHHILDLNREYGLE